MSGPDDLTTAACAKVDAVIAEAESRLEASWVRRGRNPYAAGATMAAERLGLEAQVLLRGAVARGCVFARVETDPADRRLFVLAAADDAKAGEAALICDWGDDALAVSLKPGSRRFWRLTGLAVSELAEGRTPCVDGVLLLREDAHDYVALGLTAAHWAKTGEEARLTAILHGQAAARSASGLESWAAAAALAQTDPRRVAYAQGLVAASRAGEAAQAGYAMLAKGPPGVLVLDPLAIDWTRAGALKGVDGIEILDAPADGPLGRAIVRANPRVGGKTGVSLRGLEPAREMRRRAA